MNCADMKSDDFILLKKDGVYFYAAFLDSDLSIPVIDTYIFVGLDDGEYLFRDAKDASVFISFVPDNVNCIYDRSALSRWLLEDHNPKRPKQTEYKYRISI